MNKTLVGVNVSCQSADVAVVVVTSVMFFSVHFVLSATVSTTFFLVAVVQGLVVT